MSAVDVVALIRHLNIRAERRGHKWVAKCPNPDHDDASPSWSIIDRPGDKRHGSHHCFACKFGGGPWELAAAVWKLTAEEAGKRLFEIGLGNVAPPAEVPDVVVVDSRIDTRRPYTLPLGTVIPEPGGKWYEPALDYLLDRGVTREQIDRWGIGYAIRGRLRFRVVFPVYDARGQLLTYTAREFAKGAATGGRYDQGRSSTGARPRPAIWGEVHWSDRRIATVCEGTFSGLALENAGAPNIAALLGSELTPERARKLSSFEVLLVATDPDAAGEKIASTLSVLGRRQRLIRVRLDASPDDEPPERLRERVRDALGRL